MKTLKEICGGKLSVVVRAMWDGMLEQDARPGHRVCMAAFGGVEGGECVACAATCALQKLSNHVFSSDELVEDGGIASIFSSLAYTLEANADDIYAFERAVDHLRLGDPAPVWVYLELPGQPVIPGFIFVSDWKEQEAQVKEYIQKLEELGL